MSTVDPNTSSPERLRGREEIAAFLRRHYGFGSVSYVSAMIRAGLPVERGKTTTTADVVEFFSRHPGFTFHRAFRLPKVSPTSAGIRSI